MGWGPLGSGSPQELVVAERCAGTNAAELYTLKGLTFCFANFTSL